MTPDWKQWAQRAREFLFARQTAYHKVFRGPFADVVLDDLARFCRAHQSTFHVDPRQHAVLEGRREVWLRITQHLNLSDEDLWKHYRIPTTEK